MESTLSLHATAAATRLTLTKPLNSTCNPLFYNLHRRFYHSRSSQLALLRLSRILINASAARGLNAFGSVSLSRSFDGVVLRPVQRRFECVSSSAASFSSGGGASGGSDGNSGGGGGGDGSSDAGEAKPNSVAGGADDVSALSSDVIILDVGGMTCGGCAASVKRILESQPQVSSASVNLTTETAIVWPVSDAKVVPNWKKQLGEALAKHLTTCGFTSNLRGQGAIEGDVQS